MNEPSTRREFLKAALAAGVCPAFALGAGSNAALAASAHVTRREARYYKKLKGGRVHCVLCPRECQVPDIERGYCGVRENRGGTYYTLVYGRPCTEHNDPIEKKPFFHVRPGTWAYSISTVGCCMACKYCQNWDISQVRPEQARNLDMPPAAVVENARRCGAKSIAFTYAEPVIFYEYMYDTAKLARKAGLHPIVVTSAYILEDPLRDLCQQVDAIKVDLKAFTHQFYQDICDATLAPVLKSLQVIKKSGVWLEIVYLVIPTLNDSEGEIKKMAQWVKANLGTDVPVHFTRFHPMYLLQNLPPTPVATVERCRKVALAEGLRYVYVGNVPVGNPGENTFCPKCHRVLVERRNYHVKVVNLKGGKCSHCGTNIPGLWG